MKEEEIVQKVCEIMNVRYSHYDNHNMPMDYFRHALIEVTSKPKIVAYPSQYGHWTFAILEDMTIITPTINISKCLQKISTHLRKLEKQRGLKPSKESKPDEEMLRIQKAEKWLKKNNCQKVINNPKKPILHLK